MAAVLDLEGAGNLSADTYSDKLPRNLTEPPTAYPDQGVLRLLLERIPVSLPERRGRVPRSHPTRQPQDLSPSQRRHGGAIADTRPHIRKLRKLSRCHGGVKLGA
jgi:hypothetical protein